MKNMAENKCSSTVPSFFTQRVEMMLKSIYKTHLILNSSRNNKLNEMIPLKKSVKQRISERCLSN